MSVYLYEIEGSLADVGVIVVDWEQKKLEVHGAPGYQSGQLEYADLEQIVKAYPAPRYTAYPFILWPQNAEGEPQLELEDDLTRIHDALFGDDEEAAAEGEDLDFAPDEDEPDDAPAPGVD